MDLSPGDVGFSTIGGRTGALVNIGQAVLRDSCRYTHARIVIGNSMGTTVYLEAMPGGARLGYILPYEELPGVWYRLPLDARQQYASRTYGLDLPGTPYSFADYGALALHHLAPDARLTARVRRYVTDSGHMICSQLVDHVLCRAGFHLFTDGRLPQDVTPGDLFYRVAELGQRVR